MTSEVTAGLYRAARERLKLSQREMAEQLGTTQSAISKIEAGHYAPNSLEFIRFAQVVHAKGVRSVRRDILRLLRSGSEEAA